MSDLAFREEWTSIGDGQLALQVLGTKNFDLLFLGQGGRSGEASRDGGCGRIEKESKIFP